MSTKVTLLYGNPDHDGSENDYHLYYDYKDWDVHLEINGREVPLPPKLRKELHEIIRIYENCVELIGTLVAHAEHTGIIKSNLSRIKGMGITAFNVLPEALPDEDEDELTPEELEELRERVKKLERGEEYTFSLDEVMEFVEKGYHRRIKLETTVPELMYFYDEASGDIVVAVITDEDVEVTVGLTETLDYITKHGASKRDVKKFLETAIQFLRSRG